MLFWSCSHSLVLCDFGQFLRFTFGTDVHYFFLPSNSFLCKLLSRITMLCQCGCGRGMSSGLCFGFVTILDFLHDLLVFFHADGACLSICYLCYLGIA
jgi:hypothetical protein